MEPLAADDPRQVGMFRLHSRLGAGGMGRVYRGYSPGGRAVAVKILRPEFTRDPEFMTRFRREVQAAEAVSGACTAPVIGAGPEDSPPWLATAYVPAPSLADLVDRTGPLPESAVWRLAAGLVEALQAIHGRGLVHRDLKPGNILIAVDGPRVIDFGISRTLRSTAVTARAGTAGTWTGIVRAHAVAPPASAPLGTGDRRRGGGGRRDRCRPGGRSRVPAGRHGTSGRAGAPGGAASHRDHVPGPPVVGHRAGVIPVRIVGEHADRGHRLHLPGRRFGLREEPCLVGLGNPQATATGTLEVDNCTPNCAQGTYTGYPATATLAGLDSLRHRPRGLLPIAVQAPAFNQTYTYTSDTVP